MEITIPKELKTYSHNGVLDSLLQVNPEFKKPSRTEWVGHIPDMVHEDERIAVEVEMSDLDMAWGQCLSYYRLGSKEIHLILPPLLYGEFIKDENKFLMKNPIPNVTVYELPSVPRKSLGRPPKVDMSVREITHKDPIEKFYEPIEKELNELRKQKIKSETTNELVKKRPFPRKKHQIIDVNKKRSFIKSRKHKQCKYCHLFQPIQRDDEIIDTKFHHCLACGRLV